jgi:hypothetical protein
VNAVEERHRELLGILVGHEVEFVLVGGVALQLHGFSGATLDVDVTIGVDERNATRVAGALEQLHAAPYLAGERGCAYRTDLGQLEIMRTTDGVGDYSAWMRNATPIELEPGLVVHVGSPSDLLASKEAAARDKDLHTLPQIRAELLRAGALSQADVRGPIATLPSPAPPDPRAHELLGPRPDERRSRGLWDHGADLIARYRERWQISVDSTDPLGDPPTEPAQQSDRAALERQLDRAGRLLARPGHGPSMR